MIDNAINAVYLAKMAFSDAKVKVISPNDWMKSFLKSFGQEVKCKELSNKGLLKNRLKGKGMTGR